MSRVSSHARHAGEADYTLLAYFLLLLGFGLIMLTSASAVNRFDDPFFFITRQLLYGVVPGLVLLLVLAKVPYGMLKKIGAATFGLALLLLVLVFVPGIGADYGTRAKSWISLAGFSFQPAELAKFGIILWLSAYLASIGQHIKDFRHGFLIATILGLIPVALVTLQPDLGSASMLFIIVFGLLVLAGARASHLGLLAGAAALGLVVLILIAPYRAERLTTFLNPDQHLDSTGYHIIQSEVAIGSGGWLGRGLGHSRQKHAYLPEVHADSIFAVIAEEMGFIISAAFVCFLVLIGRRGLLVAQGAPDAFGRLVAGGIILWFLGQSFINIGAMMGLLPLTGVPLPFVSHGGTALAISLAGVGVLINISKHAKT